MDWHRINVVCFTASYGLAWLAELGRLWKPDARWLRWLMVGFMAAGLLAHTLYLAARWTPTAGEARSLLWLAWIVAFLGLYGAMHYRRVAWCVFVLPVVLALIGLATLWPAAHGWPAITGPLDRWLITAHVALLVLGGVGLCVSFVASVMYLLQARRLRHKQALGEGLRLLSLERLERMIRHGVAWAFPLWTAGVILGMFLLWQRREFSWLDAKVISGAVLVLVFVMLLDLRYRQHQRGRRFAWAAIMAFVMFLVALSIEAFAPSWHRFGGGS
ncbi:MAG: cytochrome c biogenesis protein CcsA [Gemmatales bacterium]|nr:cytochrome c biogenesis protein CcsA [Gemmatales bacterium]MDW7995794.1 cytochrome c biogenesis protein CcsA [Gemmatales bacterium]